MEMRCSLPNLPKPTMSTHPIDVLGEDSPQNTGTHTPHWALGWNFLQDLPPIVNSEDVSRSVVDRARRFDSEKCANARSAANLTAWQRSNVPRHPLGLEVQQQVYFVHPRRVAYIRNQKVASRYIEQRVGALFDEEEDQAYLVRQIGRAHV